ncbi:MAG: pantoate--beta-alanine ligase [Desulfobacteraceae bacterium]
MKIIRKIKEMQNWSENTRRAGKEICLVPTMGYLHQGHLSLIKKGREKESQIVVSIFVNPAQFGENEDLNTYPSDIEKDLSLAEKEKVSVVFLPDAGEIYPTGFQTYVELTQLPHHLCGLSRPVHFRGVATVVTKLFNIVNPHTAVFGSKDFQQLCIIRQMCADLNFDIDIIAAPIVREEDGLAMSSRNAYLNPAQRQAALSLSKSLDMAETMIREKEKSCREIREAVKAYITGFPGTTIDYISLCHPETLEDAVSTAPPILVALAVNVGETRLIDNMLID